MAGIYQARHLHVFCRPESWQTLGLGGPRLGGTRGVGARVTRHGSKRLYPLSHLACPLYSQLFIGFGFPYEGPAPLEAIANGCIFLQSRFSPPHSSLNHEFFRGKPTSREVSRRVLPQIWESEKCGAKQKGKGPRRVLEPSLAAGCRLQAAG